MLRLSFAKVLLLALSTAVGGSGLMGCSADGSSDERTGPAKDGAPSSLSLRLRPVSGVDLDIVNYTVTRGNQPSAPVIKAGSVPVPGTAPSFALSFSLPVGTGYYLNLTADSTNRAATCAGGFGPFDIFPNQGSDIAPSLSCIDITGGQSDAQFEIVSTACPDLSFDHVVVTPNVGVVGSSVSLFSSATSASGKQVSYLWQSAQPAVSVIAAPTTKNTALICVGVGSDMLLTVTASNGECNKSASTKVSCFNTLPCDPALDPTCAGDCTAVCGDGVVACGETCEPPNTPSCSSTCIAKISECLNGLLDPLEACDPTATPMFPSGAPAGSACTNTCTVVSLICSCGDGALCGSETCDPPFAGNCGGLSTGAAAGASPACTAIESAACETCVEGQGLGAFDCSTLTGNAASGPAAGQSLKSLCYELLDCMYDTNCAAADPVDCYCGNSGAACQTGGANGKCRDEIEASLETTAFADVGARIGDPSYAGGVAMVRVDSARAACGSVCGTF